MPRELNERVAPDEALRLLTEADTAELMAVPTRSAGEGTARTPTMYTAST